ncbi:MAG: DNA polymerase subunit beta [Candidatus Bathyarchaeota archaeon]|nr:DNA polymerase subunit beta [Candidatus Bathyarchaeota archaeon]
MTVKPQRKQDQKAVAYTQEHWQQLKLLREKARMVMAALQKNHLNCSVHGSVARGDVKAKSDVDVFVWEIQSGFRVESALEASGYAIDRRMLVQATPNYAMKAHIALDEQTTVTFPLMEMRRVEREFYRFGGEATLRLLEADTRVAGVDKRLMLIEPTEAGHVESSIAGREESVARLLGISSATVLDRVHALTRRDEVGRTGVFVKKELAPEDTFELALKRLAEANPAVRRRIKG